MSRYGFRSIEAPDFTEGRRTSKVLNKQNIVRQYDLRIRGDFVVTGGTGAGAIFADAAFRAVRGVILKVKGRGKTANLIDVRGHTLGVIQRLLYPEEYSQVIPTDDAAASYPVEFNLPIPLHMPYSLTPDEFALPTPASAPELILDAANAEELVTGGDGAYAFGNITTELLETPLEGTAKMPYSRWHAFGILHESRPVVQDGTLRIGLPVSNGQEIRAIIVESFAGGAGGIGYAYNDALVEELSFELGGTEEFEQVSFDAVQNRNKVAYQRGAIETGVAVIDAAENQRTGPGQLFLVRGSEDPTVELKVAKQAGDCEVVVTALTATRPNGPAGYRA